MYRYYQLSPFRNLLPMYFTKTLVANCVEYFQFTFLHERNTWLLFCEIIQHGKKGETRRKFIYFRWRGMCVGERRSHILLQILE